MILSSVQGTAGTSNTFLVIELNEVADNSSLRQLLLVLADVPALHRVDRPRPASLLVDHEGSNLLPASVGDAGGVERLQG